MAPASVPALAPFTENNNCNDPAYLYQNERHADPDAGNLPGAGADGRSQAFYCSRWRMVLD
jgi:hypothetical protein